MKSSVQNKEIKELTTAELEEKLKAAVADYSKKKLNHAITPLESPIQIRDSRKFIARLKTELSNRRINNAQ
jgi:large subunit ribosomal protein L29